MAVADFVSLFERGDGSGEAERACRRLAQHGFDEAEDFCNISAVACGKLPACNGFFDERPRGGSHL